MLLTCRSFDEWKIQPYTSTAQHRHISDRGRTMKVIICFFVLWKTAILCHTHPYMGVKWIFTILFSTVCPKRISILCLFVCFFRNRFLHAQTSNPLCAVTNCNIFFSHFLSNNRSCVLYNIGEIDNIYRVFIHIIFIYIEFEPLSIHCLLFWPLFFTPHKNDDLFRCN